MNDLKNISKIKNSFKKLSKSNQYSIISMLIYEIIENKKNSWSFKTLKKSLFHEYTLEELKIKEI